MKKARYFFLILMLTASIQVSAQSFNGTWKGLLSAGPQKLTLILHVNEAERSVKLDVMEQGVKGLPLTVNVLGNDSLNVAMTQIGLHYAGRLCNGVIEGAFSQNGFTTQLIFNKGEVVLKRPQEPKSPFPYRVENVQFENQSAKGTLSGTLTYPEGYKGGQKVPVVLMVTGSGPQNRDEELMGHKPFLVLADRLARHGIASLRLWMKSALDMHFSKFLPLIKCPVMALSGSNDLNVPAEFNMQSLQNGLPHNSKNVIKIYPGLNHLFQHSPTGNPMDYVNIDETMSEEVMNDVCTWMNKVTNNNH